MMYSDEKKKAQKTAMIILTVFVVLVVIVGIMFAIIILSGGSVVDSKTENNDVETEVGTEVETVLADTFNEKLLGYQGEEISANLVKVLLTEIELSNSENPDNQIATTVSNSTTEEYLTYNVECVINPESGFIVEIKITANDIVAEATDVESISKEIKSISEEISGEYLNELVDRIVASNNSNTNRIAMKIITTTGVVVDVSKEEAINRDKIGTAPSTRYYSVSYEEASTAGYVSLLIVTDQGEKAVDNSTSSQVTSAQSILKSEDSSIYQGAFVSGINAKILLDKVQSINSASEQKIAVMYSGDNANGGIVASSGQSAIITQISEAIGVTSSYNITYIENDATEEITEIQITQNT